MSAIKRGSYPHPVLDDTNDVASKFEVFNFVFAPAVDDVQINFQIRLDDPDIQQLLDLGTARYSFRWRCGATLASEELPPSTASTHADSVGYVAWISQQDIRRSVRVEIKIVATEAIPNYRLERQHPDYGDATFSILPGDILADGGSVTFEADKRYDPLSPPVGSCFKFVSEKKQKRRLDVWFNDDEHVLVVFPEQMLQGLSGLAMRPDLQISLVVLPALMQTITYIKDNIAAGADGEDLSEKSWYGAIVELVEAAGSFDDSAFTTAQKILSNPLDTSLLVPFAEEDDS